MWWWFEIEPWLIEGWDDLPALYHGHFAYFDPRSVGVDATPVYINLIRDIQAVYVLSSGKVVEIKAVMKLETEPLG